MTRYDPGRVSPFGHPGITACLTAPPGFSQPSTSFIVSQCLGIHQTHFVACAVRSSPELPAFTQSITICSCQRPLRKILRCWRLGWLTWWRRPDSNRRPAGCKPAALPAELRPRAGNVLISTLVGIGRLELPTSRLSGARSNQLSYIPVRLSKTGPADP